MKRNLKKKGSKQSGKSKNSGGNKAGGQTTSKPPASAKKPSKKPVEVEPPVEQKRKKKQTEQEADPVRKHGKGSMQNRVNGKGGKWVYEVLPDQTLGCGNCRFIYGGCKVCQKPGFRGKSAAKMRLEQQAVQEGEGDQGECGEDWEGWTWDEETQDWVQVEEEAPKRRKGAKKRRGSSK